MSQARVSRDLSIEDVLQGQSVKAPTGNPVTLPGGRPPLKERIPGAHHPKINIEDFNWPTYPDNDEDGNFQSSIWKLSFRRKQDGVIQFYFISSPGSKRKAPSNTDLIKAVKTYKSLPLEVSAGLWWYQTEAGDDWVKLDENFSNPLDYKDVSDDFYSKWMQDSGVDKLDFIKGLKRPMTDAQIAFEKEKAKDDEIASLKAELAKLKK
jgi:hypothetical protein